MKQRIKRITPLPISKQAKRILSSETKFFFRQEKGFFWRFKTSKQEFYDKAIEIYFEANKKRDYIG